MSAKSTRPIFSQLIYLGNELGQSAPLDFVLGLANLFGLSLVVSSEASSSPKLLPWRDLRLRTAAGLLPSCDGARPLPTFFRGRPSGHLALGASTPDQAASFGRTRAPCPTAASQSIWLGPLGRAFRRQPPHVSDYPPQRLAC